MAFTTVTVNVRTFAHWIPVTKRAFADAPQLRALVDQSLLHGLAEELEDQMLTGGGTGEDFQGLAGTSGVQTQAFAENNLVTALKGRTKVKTVGRARPTAYLLHPTDLENLLLWRDTQGHFMMSDPAGGSRTTTSRCGGYPSLSARASRLAPATSAISKSFISSTGRRPKSASQTATPTCSCGTCSQFSLR